MQVMLQDIVRTVVGWVERLTARLPQEQGHIGHLRAGLALCWLGCLVAAANQSQAAPTATPPISLIGSSILALNLNQQDSVHWVPYTGGDSPEGAYMGWMFAGETSVTGLIRLPRPLSPGHYSIFIKGINYDRGVNVQVMAGSSGVTIATDDRDWNRYWSNAGPLEVQATTSELRLTFQKLSPVGDDSKFLLRGLYITDQANVVILRTDVVVDLTYPTQMDDTAPEPGNVIENGSFEVGLGHGWGLAENRTVPLQPLWDKTQAYHGQASVKLPLDPSARSYGEDLSLVSKIYTLKPNKQYTLSAWVKTASNDNVSGSLSIVNTFDPPPGYPGKEGLVTTFTATSNWQRVSVTGYLRKYPTSDYQITITGRGGAGQYLWIDAVQLEEGAVSDAAIKPTAPLELGLVTTQPSRVFYEDEPIRMDLLAHNGSGHAVSGEVKYVVYDYLNRKVREGGQSVNVAAQTTQTTALNLPTGLRGVFRVVVWLNGQDKTLEEVVYSVVPRPRTTGADPTSMIGIHSNFETFQFDVLERLGVKWDDVMSPASFFRWSLAEPQDDQFVWYDAEIQLALDRGVTILGTIGYAWPAWADSNGVPNLDKWEEFVGQMVAHYRGRIHYWEIWNEPNRAWGSQPDLYAQILKRAVDAIERTDPDAKIVSMGGAQLYYIEQVIASLQRLYPTWNWAQHVDAVSTHLYPLNEGGAEDFKTRIIDVYHLPVWNTEIGEWDWGFYLGSNSNFVAWGENLFPHTDAERYYETSPDTVGNLTKNFLTTIGAGFSKYFYYDSRIIAAPNTLRTQPTILEYDDTVRPKGVAYSILAYLFDHSVGLGRIPLQDANAVAYLFDRAGTPLVGLWTGDKGNGAVTLSLPASQYKVYDSMGNPLTVSNGVIPYGRTPVYIEGQGISAAALRSALEGAPSGGRADTTPPNLTIASAPLGPTRTRQQRLRWIAIDETSVPDPTLPDAILYSYRLSGPAGEGNWSAWAANTYVDYTLAPGTYTFSVKAKDAAGNETPVVSTSFTILGDVYYTYLPLVSRNHRP